MIRIVLAFIISISSFAGIYEPNAVWGKKEVKVCFYDSEEQLTDTLIGNKTKMKMIYGAAPKELDDSHKNLVKSIVKQEYTEAKTGIHFVGWKNCSRTSDFDLVILFGESFNKNFKPKPISTSIPIFNRLMNSTIYGIKKRDKVGLTILAESIEVGAKAFFNDDLDINTQTGEIKAKFNPGYLGMASMGEASDMAFREAEVEECKEFDSIKKITDKDCQGEQEIGFELKSGKKAHVILTDYKKATAVHEFGHASSLRHGHIHPETQCERAKRMGESIGFSAIVSEKADNDSVMSYCKMWDLQKNDDSVPNFLSQEDKKLLFEIYKDKPLN